MCYPISQISFINYCMKLILIDDTITRLYIECSRNVEIFGTEFKCSVINIVFQFIDI